jgi:hypothetical protein
MGIFMILLAFGWKEDLLNGVTDKVILLFFMFWIGLSFFHIEVTKAFHLNLVVFILLFLIGYTFAKIKSFKVSAGILMTSFILAGFYFSLQQLFFLDPILIVFHPAIDTAVFLSIFIFLTYKKPLHQIAVVSIGLLIGTFSFQFVEFSTIGMSMELGYPEFQDQWWITVAAVRFLTVFWEYMAAAFRFAFQRNKS